MVERPVWMMTSFCRTCEGMRPIEKQHIPKSSRGLPPGTAMFRALLDCGHHTTFIGRVV